MDISHLTETFANLPLKEVAIFAAVLCLLRLALVRASGHAAHIAIEIVDAVLIAVVAVFMIIQPLMMKSFYIPSSSMRETLIEDDHIACNKLLYRFENPRREDVVIFVPPKGALEQSPEGYHPSAGPVYYIKRLIGLSGDVIQTRRGYIVVNGREASHEDIRAAFNIPITQEAQDREHVKIEANDLAIYDGAKWTRYSAQQIGAQFSIPGASVVFHPGVTIRNGSILSEPYTAEDPDYDFKLVDGHSVLTEPYGDTLVDGVKPSPGQVLALRSAPAASVPVGSLFVMGDNRNDSGDSTHWGPLARRNLAGKASLVFWPLQRMRIVQ